MDSDIDFIIPWVDGSDSSWLQCFKQFYENTIGEDTRIIRYRDWHILNYWFRTVELYAPWVRKIHFITWGHIPDWLDTAHPKLNIVKHEDYIPERFNPVFSANPIELNLHRIDGLAENFIFFNDDMFLTKPVLPEDFFVNGKPCDFAILNAHSGGDITSIVMNDIRLINNEFDKYEVIRNNFFKWFNYKYKHKNLQTCLLMPWKRFTGFVDPHQPQSFNKQTFIDTWQLYEKEMTATSQNRFRSLSDFNQYYMRYRQLVTGEFNPYMRKSKMFFLQKKEIQDISKAFSSKYFHTICLNDMSETTENFESMQLALLSILNKNFPEKSSFEI